jgi:hypothetical protein
MQKLELITNSKATGDKTTPARFGKIPSQSFQRCKEGCKTSRMFKVETCLYSESPDKSPVSFQISVLKEQVNGLKAQNERLLKKISQINASS